MYSGGGEDGKTRSEKNERATRPSKEEKDGIQNGEQSAHNSQQLKRFVPCHAMLCFAMPCHAICVVCLVIRYPFVRAHMCVPVCIDRWCVWCVQRRTMRKTIHQPHDFYNGKRGSTEKNDQIQKKKKQHEQKKIIRYGEATKNKKTKYGVFPGLVWCAWDIETARDLSWLCKTTKDVAAQDPLKCFISVYLFHKLSSPSSRYKHTTAAAAADDTPPAKTLGWVFNLTCSLVDMQVHISSICSMNFSAQLSQQKMEYSVVSFLLHLFIEYRYFSHHILLQNILHIFLCL